MAANKFDLGVKAGVIDKIKTLAPKLQRKYLNSAVRAGAVIVQQAAIAKAKTFDDPKTPSTVWKDIVIRANKKLGRANQGVAMSVGVLGGARKTDSGVKTRGKTGRKTFVTAGNVYYWRFKEFGTAKMKADPFMRPALANNVDTVTDTIVGKVNDGIDDIIKGVK